jgi:hypothetical protein
MEHRKLGRTELEVSEIGLGTEYLKGQPRETVLSIIGLLPGQRGRAGFLPTPGRFPTVRRGGMCLLQPLLALPGGHRHWPGHSPVGDGSTSHER